MKYIIKKILSYILPNFLYKFIKHNYYFLTFIFNPLIIKSYFNSIYYKKNKLHRSKFSSNRTNPKIGRDITFATF